jgi:hypothetical protein
LDKKLALYWRAIQPSLFPGFEQETGPQTPQHGRLLVVLDWLEIEQFSNDQLPARGRPRRCRSDLMRAFVAKPVLGVALISPQKRQGDVALFDPAQHIRMRERTTIERVFSRLKDHFGASQVRVRGHAKVSAHLMFGILALTVEQIVRTFH